MHSSLKILGGLGFGLALFAQHASAAVVPLDEGWYQKSGSTPTAVADARFTGGEAVQYTGGSNVPLYGSLGGSLFLENTGDYITVSFEFLNTTNNTYMFGLVSADAGTGSKDPINANGAIGFSDDGGYFGRVPEGSSSFTRIYKDAGVAGTGLMAGSDYAGIGTDGANANYASANVQTASITVSRTVSGVSISYSVNGTPILTRDDTSDPIYIFDGLGVNHFNSTTTLLLGNVTVDGVYTVIPEPAHFGLAGALLGLVALACYRRARV
jgi:hypothetical protein